MKRFLLLAFVFVTIAYYGLICFANDKEEMPPWMENVTLNGRSTYLVPKGAKREIIGSQVVVEPPNEYTARRLYELQQFLDGRFAQIENWHQNITQETDALKKEIESLKDALTLLEQKLQSEE